MAVKKCQWMGGGKDAVLYKELKGCVVAVVVDPKMEEELVVW